MQRQLLTDDEIRMGMMIVRRFQMAEAQRQMAVEMEAEFMTQLREKYKLGPQWVCNDLLEGFVTNDENN